MNSNLKRILSHLFFLSAGLVLGVLLMWCYPPDFLKQRAFNMVSNEIYTKAKADAYAEYRGEINKEKDEMKDKWILAAIHDPRTTECPSCGKNHPYSEASVYMADSIQNLAKLVKQNRLELKDIPNPYLLSVSQLLVSTGTVQVEKQN